MHCDLRSIVISALPEVFDSMSQKRQYYVKKMRTLLGIRYSQGNLVKLRFPVTEFIANITSHYWSAIQKLVDVWLRLQQQQNVRTGFD